MSTVPGSCAGVLRKRSVPLPSVLVVTLMPAKLTVAALNSKVPTILSGVPPPVDPTFTERDTTDGWGAGCVDRVDSDGCDGADGDPPHPVRAWVMIRNATMHTSRDITPPLR